MAAMALPRTPHPCGYTLTLLPLAGSAEQHLKNGWDWVDKAREALKQGRVPSPNPHTGPLTLRYQLTDGQQRVVFFELVDYSGELLDPSLSQTDLAARLRSYLAEVDGLLCIAEHPRRGETPRELAGYLQHLNQALALLGAEQREKENVASAPIALLVNKWDRRGDCPFTRSPAAHDEESALLLEFFQKDPPPPHAALLDALRAVAGGVCRAFPVSAFGAAVREPGENPGEYIERPACVDPELPAFGLEEPFLWLVLERDRRDTKELEALSFDKELWWNFRMTWSCAQRARRCSKRMPHASSEAHTVRAVERRLQKRFSAHFALLILLALLTEFFSDGMVYRRMRSAMNNPEDPSGWSQAESWYLGYSESGPWRHVLYRVVKLGKSAAAAELNRVRKDRDETAWRNVQQIQEEAAKVKLAEIYLKQFSAGIHRSEAAQLILSEAIRKKNETLCTQLEGFTARGESIESEITEQLKNPKPDLKQAGEKIEKLLIELNNLATEDAYESTSKIRREQITKLSSLNGKIERLIVAGDKRKRYHLMIEAGRWEEAGRFLAGLDKTESADLHEDYKSKVLGAVQILIEENLGNGAAWKNAEAELLKFQSKELEEVMPASAKSEFSKIKEIIQKKGDRWLYSQCTSGASVDIFKRYKDEAPIQKMARVVDDWISFLQRRDSPNRFRVGLKRITWGRKAQSAGAFLTQTKCRLSINLGSNTPVETEFSADLQSYSWEPARVSDHACDTRGIVAREPQLIEVRVKDLAWREESLGSLKLTSMLDELNGLTRDLVDTEYGTNGVTFFVEFHDGSYWRPFGKPLLPDWGTE
jgi:hypothetical protein